MARCRIVPGDLESRAHGKEGTHHRDHGPGRFLSVGVPAGPGYEVHGIVRRVALEDPANRLSRIHHIRGRLKLHAASLESYASIHRVVHEVQPDECYHLAAQSFVSYSFDDEFSTLNANINGPPPPQDLT